MLLNVALQLGVINDGSSWPLYYGKRSISTFDRQFKSLTCCPTRPRHRGLPPKLVPPKHLFITSFPKRKTPKKTKSNIKTYSPKHWLNRETSLKRRKTLKGKNSWAQALKKESSPFWKVHRPSLIKLKCAFIKVRSSPVFFYSSQSRSWSRGSWSSRPAVAVFRQAGAADLPRKVFIFWCTSPNPPTRGRRYLICCCDMMETWRNETPQHVHAREVEAVSREGSWHDVSEMCSWSSFTGDK